MGDIKKQKKKYQKPYHPWQKTRIVSEQELMTEYGLTTKKEVWRVDSLLTSFKDQVKLLTVKEGRQADLERKQLRERMVKFGIVKADDPLDTVLALDVKVLMERRLQTLVMRKGLARSSKQARQFITHRHITVNGKVITVPGYLVKLDEEQCIGFNTASGLYDIEHPERVQVKKVDEKVEKKKGKKEAVSEEEKRILTDEEIEAKEIEVALGSEEEQEIARLETETPEKEVEEIMKDGKTEMERLKK